MAFNQIMKLFFIALTLASVEHSLCQVLKGTVRCLDCNKDYDFSGIKVAVKCNQVKKLVETTTSKDGTFKTELPTDTRGPVNCLAKVLGGPNQLYASKEDMVSNVVMDHDSGHSSSYTISNPLSVITHKTYANIVSSKTIDFPLPKEWGLAPSSYYMYPYIPIIGIP